MLICEQILQTIFSDDKIGRQRRRRPELTMRLIRHGILTNRKMRERRDERAPVAVRR